MDDEIIVREALKVMIDKIENVRVAGEAASAAEALHVFEASDPDMTFLDIKIPGKNTLDLIKHMKRLYPKNKVILLSDYGSYEQVFKALEAGADGYLLKPYLQKDIIHLVNLYLGKVRSVKSDTEQMMKQLIEYVFKEDSKKATEQLKAISLELLLVNNNEAVRFAAEYIVKSIEAICREMGIAIAKREWTKQIDDINIDTFESSIQSVLEEVFGIVKDSQPIQDIKLIQSVLNYIEQNYQKGVTLEETAEHVHLSPFYLSKLFKKELKINFVSYVTDRKIDKAKELLETTDLPILNIALDLNYQEPNYFSKVFKKVVGMTPSEYRKDKQHFEPQLFKRSNQILNGKWYI
jgi:two-component system response regulator YesN